jgi:hypothetical protein
MLAYWYPSLRQYCRVLGRKDRRLHTLSHAPVHASSLVPCVQICD